MTSDLGEGIYSATLNIWRDPASGKANRWEFAETNSVLKHKGDWTNPSGHNPSFLKLAFGGKVLLAANEYWDEAVSSLTVGSGLSLKRKQEYKDPGNEAPVYIDSYSSTDGWRSNI